MCVRMFAGERGGGGGRGGEGSGLQDQMKGVGGWVGVSND